MFPIFLTLSYAMFIALAMGEETGSVLPTYDGPMYAGAPGIMRKDHVWVNCKEWGCRYPPEASGDTYTHGTKHWGPGKGSGIGPGPSGYPALSIFGAQRLTVEVRKGMDKDLRIRVEVTSHGHTTSVTIDAGANDFSSREAVALCALECERRNQQSSHGFSTRRSDAGPSRDGF